MLSAPAWAQMVRVRMETQLGVVELELDQGRAPVTTANFLKYVDGGFYNGASFHRTVTMSNQSNNRVRIEVIQAGINPARQRDEFAPIPRDGPDTATSDFFICIGDLPSLDFGGKRNPDGQGFAAFGRVISGMDVVKKIQHAPAAGQKLTPVMGIRKMERVGAGR